MQCVPWQEPGNEKNEKTRQGGDSNQETGIFGHFEDRALAMARFFTCQEGT